MSIIYFIILLFFIILFFVISYIFYSIAKRAVDISRTNQLAEEMRPLFEAHLTLGNPAAISKSEILDIHRKIQTKAGLQAFNSLYFERLEREGLTKSLQDYVNEVVDIQTVYKNRIVRNKYRKSYILYLFAEYSMKSDEVIQFAMKSLDDPSQYVRNNALRVLRNTGSIDAMIEAYHKISKGKLYFNNKVILDFIDSFQGDKQKLNKILGSRILEFSPQIQKVIIDHFSNRRIKERSNEILTLMKGAKDQEVIIAGIKYFGVIEDQDAYHFIVEKFKSPNFEIRAVCAKAIALYPCEQTIKLLEQNITDLNWYVRYNCAFTLIKLEGDQVFRSDSSVGKIICGKDSFAKEITIYTLYSKGLITAENYQEKLAYFQEEKGAREEVTNGLGTNHLLY